MSPYRKPTAEVEPPVPGPSFTARIDGGWSPGCSAYRFGMFDGAILHGRSLDDLRTCAVAVGIGSFDMDGIGLCLTFHDDEQHVVVTEIEHRFNALAFEVWS